jgi:hypothetical protein
MTEAEADAIAETSYGAGWRSPHTMPMRETVEVLTVMGLIRTARTTEYAAMEKGGMLRRHCWKVPKTGDLQAVAWRPL